MKTLNISWVGTCQKCECEKLKVETEHGCGFRLFDGDKVICPQCGETGVVWCEENFAKAAWDCEKKS